MPQPRWRREDFGRMAYNAYWQSWRAWALPWGRLSRREKRAWQAAAWCIVQTIKQPSQPVELPSLTPNGTSTRNRDA